MFAFPKDVFLFLDLVTILPISLTSPVIECKLLRIGGFTSGLFDIVSEMFCEVPSLRPTKQIVVSPNNGLVTVLFIATREIYLHT